MQTLALPFGSAGLDRLSGAMAARPGSLRDARNVIVGAGGKIKVRQGMEEVATLPNQGGHPCTHIPLLEAMRFEAVGVAVGYYAASRELHLYRLTGEGGAPTHIGHLFTLHESASAPPRLHAAEVGGRLFIAHDEPLQSRRAATYVYDPLGAEVLFPLEAAFSGAGSAPARFRGVLPWHGYLAGWGFASATESRPEIVRISLPGQPLAWDASHYFIAGTQGDPALSVRPAGGHLLVRKASQTYRIHGSSHLDFGITPLHALSGTLGHRLSIELDGRLYDWSAEGPVLYTGAVEPGRLEVPLDLKGPQPADFRDLDYASGYVQYRPEERALEWVFGPVSFVLALDSGEWSYGQSALSRSAGALLYSGASLADDLDQAPRGYARDLVATPGATVATIAWTNTDQDGNEMAEVWIRRTGGAWAIGAQVPVTEAATESAPLASLVVADTYDWAVRFRRGGRYTAGYEGDDPTTWPAASRASFTTKLEAPTLDNVVWSRTSASSERARIFFTPADPGVRHQVLRDNGVVDTLEPGVVFYDDTGISGETSHTWAVRAVIGEYESALSNQIARWMGPDPGPSAAHYTNTGLSCGDTTEAHSATWTAGDLAWHTEISVRGVPLPSLVDPGLTELDQICAEPDDPAITLRHAVQSFGTWDYTPSTTASEAP